MSVAEHATIQQAGAAPVTGASEAEAMFDLDALREAPVKHDPYSYLVVPNFVRPEPLAAIGRDFPDIKGVGPVEPHEIASGPAFEAMVRAFGGPELQQIFADKFGEDMLGKPSVFKIRKYEVLSGGYIHTDSRSKLLAALIYFNAEWPAEGGRFRVLRSGTDMDDYAEEILPLDGTLVVFRRCDHSFHGYKPYEGERRMIQMNYVDPSKLEKSEQGIAKRATKLVKSLFKTKGHVRD
jgi:hypothetical protein